MSTSTPPSTAATAVVIDASSVTSSANVRHPAASSAASVSILRAVAYTVKRPDRASRAAVACPMPDEQPVISRLGIAGATL